MKTISFDKLINISKTHFKNLEEFQIYIAEEIQKEITDEHNFEVNENPENYSTLNSSKTSFETKEISLESETLGLLKNQAKKNGQKLINYMERVLKEKANELELSDEYKLMMDDLLDKHEKNQLNFISEEDFFKSINR